MNQVIMNDISEKMRVKRMKEIDSFKNDILSTITHNLKTPLNGIILIAQSLQNQVNPKVKDAFSDILQNSKMLLYMINDILDYSRLSKGNIHLNLETFSIKKLINEVLSIYKRQTQEKSIKLNYVLMGNLQTSCKLINDFNRIKQILINLVGNAAKCTFEGSITLIFEITSPNLLHISIKDTGIGMTNETIRSIQKIQMKRKQDMRHGVGIGLLIGKSLLQLVGPDREFKIESQEHQGSTFSFQVYLIHKKSKNNNTNGLEISHLQNFFQIDKSGVVGFDGNASLINPRVNYHTSRSRNNKINTILEEGKPQENQEGNEDKFKMEFKECISQRILPDDQAKNDNLSPRITDTHDTQQNFLTQNYQSRRNTTDFYEKYKKDTSILRRGQKNSENSNFLNINDSHQTDLHSNPKIQKQDLDFKNLLKNQKLNPNQTSMDEFEDEDELNDGNVAHKYTENNINDIRASRVRVLPYHINSIQQVNHIRHLRVFSGASDTPSSHIYENIFSSESSPTCPFKLSNNSNEKKSQYIDANEETIPENIKFNFYLNSQLTDSIYTQDSKVPDSYNASQFISKSQKNTKLSQYNNTSNNNNSSGCSSPPQLSLLQSQSNPTSRNIVLTKEDHKQGQKVDFNTSNNNNYLYLSYTPKQQVISESSNNSTNVNVNSKQYIIDQTPISTTTHANNTPMSPLREKLKSRQYSLSDNREKQIGKHQNLQYQPVNQILKFNSNANLDDSKRVSQNYYHGGQGRLYEYIEESRDQDDNKQENIGEILQRQFGLNKFHTIHSSTTLTVEKNNINMTISQNVPYLNMRLYSQPQINYQQAINEFFESAPRNILIVDDTVFNIKALRNLLLKYKTAKIEEAFNGLQAVQKVQQAQFDIIFMDINMPVMDGFEATKQIRELQKENKILYKPIIIIVTAFGDQENKMLSFQSGADEHIEKPLSLDSIQKAIFQLIKR